MSEKQALVFTDRRNSKETCMRTFILILTYNEREKIALVIDEI